MALRWLLATLILILVEKPCSASTIVVRLVPAAREAITIRRSDTLEVRYARSPSSEAGWQIRSLHPSIMTLVDIRYEGSAHHPQLSGEQVMLLQPTNIGKVQIIFEFAWLGMKSAERDNVPVAHVRVTISE